jgi:hypothetical protein
MNIHEILLKEVIVYAIVSFLINSMKQSPEEFNICSVGCDNYRTPEFSAVFTGPCIEPVTPAHSLISSFYNP